MPETGSGVSIPSSANVPCAPHRAPAHLAAGDSMAVVPVPVVPIPAVAVVPIAAVAVASMPVALVRTCVVMPSG